MTGCKALEGCDQRRQCYRHQLYLHQTPYVGWSAYQQCRLSAFTPKLYLFYEKIPQTPGDLQA